jgi:hypothetical protein
MFFVSIHNALKFLISSIFLSHYMFFFWLPVMCCFLCLSNFGLIVSSLNHSPQATMGTFIWKFGCEQENRNVWHSLFESFERGKVI